MKKKKFPGDTGTDSTLGELQELYIMHEAFNEIYDLKKQQEKEEKNLHEEEEIWE